MLVTRVGCFVFLTHIV